MYADDCLYELLGYDFESVIDVGCGDQEHYKVFKGYEKNVTGVSLREPCDIMGDFMILDLPQVDCIWASHVMEHQLNVGHFICRCLALLKDDGILAITVPPMKPELAAGHFTLWTKELLVYNLVMAGLDCSGAWVKEYGYNISVILRKNTVKLPKIGYDAGDLFKLNHLFPFEVRG
jgi:hypothetical protein